MNYFSSIQHPNAALQLPNCFDFDEYGGSCQTKEQRNINPGLVFVGNDDELRINFCRIIAFPEWARFFHAHPTPVDEVCGGALDQSCLK